MEHGELCLMFWEEETTQTVLTQWGEQVPVETYEGLPIMTELALFA
jgi:hypothetical protein